MDYQSITVWGIIRRFLLGWTIAGVLLIVASCVKYKDFIIEVLTNNTWAWINAVMPVLIIIFGIAYLLKVAFR